MTSMFHWLDVNRRRCATSRQRRFNCATSFDASFLPDYYPTFISSHQFTKTVKKEGRKKKKKKEGKSHQLLSVRIECFYYVRLVSLPLNEKGGEREKKRKKEK